MEMDNKDLKRSKATSTEAPKYPDTQSIGNDRRGFLRFLGAAFLGTAAAGLTKGALANPLDDPPLPGGSPSLEEPVLSGAMPAPKEPEDEPTAETPKAPEPAPEEEVARPGEAPAVPEQPEYHLDGDEPPLEPPKE